MIDESVTSILKNASQMVFDFITISSRVSCSYSSNIKIENKMTFADRIERVGTLLQMLDMLL